MRERGEWAPGPDLHNQLVNRHGCVNVNPVCMSTGEEVGGSLGLSRSLKFSIKNQPPFLCGLMPLVDMGIVANKSIDFIGFKYAVVTSLV